MIANSITISRIIFSIILFFITKESNLFTVLYILCGISDVLDGFMARVLHTESNEGAMLDSLGDLIFGVVYIFKILPNFSLLFCDYVWIIFIAIVKIIIIVLTSIKKRRFYIEHSYLNKITGILLFILPLSINFINIRYGVITICVFATISIIDEMYKIINK